MTVLGYTTHVTTSEAHGSDAERPPWAPDILVPIARPHTRFNQCRPCKATIIKAHFNSGEEGQDFGTISLDGIMQR
jgi:hypothetical protein